MEPSDVDTALESHLRAFFAGHEASVHTWPRGRILQVQPRFHVLRFAPGPRVALWSYCSVGAWEVSPDGHRRLEFSYLAQVETPRMVELLAMLTAYHANHQLDYAHTLPIGEPWLPGSTLDHVLISTPYPLGPDFEACTSGAHAHFTWALPITAAERDFKAAHGLEALEGRFEDARLEYWNPQRQSVV